MAEPMNARLALEDLRRNLMHGVVPIGYHPYGRRSILITLSNGQRRNFSFHDDDEFAEVSKYVSILTENKAEYDRRETKDES